MSDEQNTTDVTVTPVAPNTAPQATPVPPLAPTPTPTPAVQEEEVVVHMNQEAVKDIMAHTTPLGEDGHVPFAGGIPLSEPLSAQDKAVRDSF